MEEQDTGKFSTARVRWKNSHRLILSRYPPVDLFDDLSPPEDWELLAQAESRTNPRVLDQVGDLSLVPVERRVSGPGASWVMAAFTHVSPDRTSRFSDGSYGVYYCAQDQETAIRETAYHQGRFLALTKEEPGWIIEMRELVAPIDRTFTDLRTGDHGDLLNPDDYSASQQAGHLLRASGSNGIVYPSQRHEGGQCLAAFWPDVIGRPQQASHWKYHWNGETIDYVKKLSINGNTSHKPYKL